MYNFYINGMTDTMTAMLSIRHSFDIWAADILKVIYYDQNIPGIYMYQTKNLKHP